MAAKENLRHNPSQAYYTPRIALQRHFSVLTKFANVESRLSGRKRQREVVFYVPVNLCERRACSASVAVGIFHIRTVMSDEPDTRRFASGKKDRVSTFRVWPLKSGHARLPVSMSH